MFMSLAAWGMSSPVGSSPDDDFHLVSIWCAHGTSGEFCQEGAAANSRMVPSALIADSVCFAGKPSLSAACQKDSLQDLTVDDRVDTSRGNMDGLYPPVFYWVIGLFASGNAESSVVAMRIFNAALFTALVTALTVASRANLRPAIVIPALVVSVPLGMFIIPSTNGSSWAMISAALVTMAVVGFIETELRRSWLLGGLAAVGVLMGAGARADAAVYAAFALVLGTILAWDDRKAIRWKLPLLGALLTISITLYFATGQSTALATGLQPNAPAQSLVRLVVGNFVGVPTLWQGMVGGWGLGWLDTAMPGVVSIAMLVVVGGTVFLGIAKRSGAKTIAVLLAFAALWLVPLVMQVQSRAFVGAYVQPRYILPLGIILVATALFVRANQTTVALSTGQWVTVTIGSSMANAIALHSQIRRYVTGTDVLGLNLNTGSEWWWSVGPSPMATWLVGSLCFFLALSSASIALCRAARDPSLASFALGGSTRPQGEGLKIPPRL